MTNSQLAAARRAFNRFPGIVPEKDGNILTPKRVADGVEGAPIEILDTMSDAEIQQAIFQSIAGMS